MSPKWFHVIFIFPLFIGFERGFGTMRRICGGHVSWRKCWELLVVHYFFISFYLYTCRLNVKFYIRYLILPHTTIVPLPDKSWFKSDLCFNALLVAFKDIIWFQPNGCSRHGGGLGHHIKIVLFISWKRRVFIVKAFNIYTPSMPSKYFQHECQNWAHNQQCLRRASLHKECSTISFLHKFRSMNNLSVTCDTSQLIENLQQNGLQWSYLPYQNSTQMGWG